MAKILIVGCGAIGMGLAEKLVNQGHVVTGLKRNPESKIDRTFSFYRGDITKASDLRNLNTDFDTMVFMVAPEARNEPSYRAVYEQGIHNLLQHFAVHGAKPVCLLVSSTSVYAQHQGEWIDENSPAQPVNITSKILRKAELNILASDSRNIVIRFSGIYGPGREYLMNRVRQRAAFQKTPTYFTNRIHQQDCIGVLAFLLTKLSLGAELEPIYLASDDKPASQWQVVTWLAEKMQVQQPAQKLEQANSSMNKRCSNRKIKAAGYEFIYPSYIEGYGKMVRDQEQ